MSSTKQMHRSLSITEARNTLPRLIREVERGTCIHITRRGDPVAVVLSVGEYQRLATDRRDVWEAISEFRQAVDLEEVLGDDDPFAGVRDGTRGRDVEV